MSLKKKLAAIAICLLLLLSQGAPVLASAAKAPAAPDLSLVVVKPMLVYISRVSTNLTISGSGLVTATGSITGYPGITDAVYIFLDLQAYVNGSWVTIGSWSNMYPTYYGVLSGQCYVSSGYTYRVRGTYYAHSDYDFESIEQNSRNVYY